MSGEGNQRKGGSLEEIREIDISERTLSDKVVDVAQEYTLAVAGIVVVTLATLVFYWMNDWTVVTETWLLLGANVGLIGYVLLKVRTLFGGIWALLMTTAALWLVDSAGSNMTIDLLFATIDLPGPTLASAGFVLVLGPVQIPFPSLDTFVFLLLTLALAVYFIISYRNDRKLE